MQTLEIVQPDWLRVTRIGSAFEEEVDVNARPQAPVEQAYRHRKRTHTGDAVEDWRPGLAPDA